MATLGGIMDYLADHSSDVKIVVKSGTTTISANNSKVIDCSTECGTGTLIGVSCRLGDLQLPWFRTGTSDGRKTWIQRYDNNTFTIYNSDDAWTNYAYTAILFISP